MDAKQNGEQGAFARPITKSEDGFTLQAQDGLTKREYIAALAMQGMLANPHAYEQLPASDYLFEAVKFADALLAELAKEPPCK